MGWAIIMTSIKKLVAKQIGTLPVGLHGDGGNLYLSVRPGGSRQWVMRYRFGGKQREMSLGGAGPGGMTLAEARARADKVRAQLRDGIDPLETKTAAAKIRSVPTFKLAMEEFISRAEPSWKNPKSADQWRASLTTHAVALLNKKVDQISVDDIIAVLDPIWYSLPETAKRVRGRIENILSMCKTKGHRSGENPAAWRDNLKNIFKATPKLVRGHFTAMDYEDIPDFIVKLRRASSLSALVNEWIILTVVRASVGVSPTWSEIDLQKGIWTIPAIRMKGDLEAAVVNDDHVVPLAQRALEILAAVSPLRITGKPDEYVFPSQNLKTLSLTSLDHCRERLNIDVTTHGFRTTFRTWAAQETFHEDALAEKALAHLVGDETQRAYNRGDLLAKRRVLMNDWADYLSEAISPERNPFVRQKGLIIPGVVMDELKQRKKI
jgi:integrase